MRMKKTVSAVIFSSLFLSAWYIQEQEEKRNVWTSKDMPEPAGLKGDVVETDSIVEIQPVAEVQEEMMPEPFKPREYIRLAK